MNVVFRIDEGLLADLRFDLVRKHRFAHERVGFITIRAAAGLENIVLTADRYYPVADELYVDDPHVGARIDQEALRQALEIALLQPVGVFHVHMHEFGTRRLWFSDVDLSEQEQFVPDFFKVRPSIPHGALVLSHHSLAGRVWLDKHNVLPIREFNVVGRKIQLVMSDEYGTTDFYHGR